MRRKNKQRENSEGYNREHWNLPPAHGAANRKQQLLYLQTQNIQELKAPGTVNVRLRLSTGKRAERLFYFYFFILFLFFAVRSVFFYSTGHVFGQPAHVGTCSFQSWETILIISLMNPLLYSIFFYYYSWFNVGPSVFYPFDFLPCLFLFPLISSFSKLPIGFL